MRDIPDYTNSDSLALSWKLHDLREAARVIYGSDLNPDQLAHFRQTMNLLREVEAMTAPKSKRVDVAA